MFHVFHTYVASERFKCFIYFQTYIAFKCFFGLGVACQGPADQVLGPANEVENYARPQQAPERCPRGERGGGQR
jgi:hypothetical protein